jgi:hypothetical protein
LQNKLRSAAVAAATVAASTLALVPASAHAIGVTLSNDAGADAPWVGDRGVQTNMNPTMKIGFEPGEEGSYSAVVAGPDGVAVTNPINCYSINTSRPLDYRGNGTYRLTINKYPKADRSCTGAPSSSATASYTVNAAVTLSGPATPVLMRAPNSFITQPIALPFSGKPVGALGYEVRYALNGAVGPDGAIAGPSTETVRDDATGAVQFRPPAPGRYVFVARGKGFSTASGQFFTPWTPPVTVVAMAPFDIGRPIALDSRGPSYKLRFRINEASTTGRVNIAIARGKKGGKYKSYGSVKISSKATFIKRFTLRRSGHYRMRLKYKGNGTTAGGTIVHRFRITKRYF